MNRGTAISVVTADTPGHLHVAWANTVPNQTCSGPGNVITIQVAFDGCADPVGCFRLGMLALVDDSNVPTYATIDGANATVLGGGANHCSALNGAQGGNQPPLVGLLPDRLVEVGTLVQVQPQAIDPESDPVVWSGQNLPSGASINSASGVLSWLPSSDQVGTYEGVTLTANDGSGSGSAAFSFSVTAPGHSPTFVPRFGLFRAINSPQTLGDIGYLGHGWTYRDIRPRLDTNIYKGVPYWRFLADSLVNAIRADSTELVFNLIVADRLDANGRYDSRPPANETEWVAWENTVRFIVDRYNADGDSSDLPNLKYAVKHWHLEEEDTFWNDLTPNSYVDYLARVRTAIKGVDSDAQIIAIGLKSENCWTMAYRTGHVKLVPANQDTTSIQQWITGTRNLLQNGQYDIVDMHCYEQSSIIKGKIDWLRSQMPNTKPIWCFEGGGPFQTRTEGYTDTLNAFHVWMEFAEALGAGMQRFAWSYAPTTDQNTFSDERFMNIALKDSIAFALWTAGQKAAFHNYTKLNLQLAGFSSVQDVSLRNGTNEKDYLHAWRFNDPSGRLVGAVAWYPTGISGSGLTRRLALYVGPDSGGSTGYVVPAALFRGDKPDTLEFISKSGDSLIYQVSARPVLILSPNHFTAVMQSNDVPGSMSVIHSFLRGLTVSWQAPRTRAALEFAVFDVTGRAVVHVVLRGPGGPETAGEYQWNRPRDLGTGLFFTRMWSGSRTQAVSRFVSMK